MKTILVPIELADTMTATLEAALLLARSFDSYIEGFALRPALTGLIDMDGSISLTETFAHQNLEAEKDARALFETFMRAHDIPTAGVTRRSLSYGWLANAPMGDQFVGSHGRTFDVTVLGRPGPDPRGPHLTALEVALFESGHPILIVPPVAPKAMGRNVLIAWNSSTEQARATSFALPLLKKAERVTVLTVEGGSGVPGPSGDQVCRYLEAHGVPVAARSVPIGERSTGEVILATATELGCDLLVKGAYTQSRLRQMIFGGATRDILARAALPVLMAH